MSRRVKPLIAHAFPMPQAAPGGESPTKTGRRKRFLLRRRMEWWMS
jgi:hypothetical protein